MTLSVSDKVFFCYRKKSSKILVATKITYTYDAYRYIKRTTKKSVLTVQVVEY